VFMKTIAQFVEDGINSLPDLQDALQLAQKLEFATIPPYLCAQWSIDPTGDPSDVADMIQDIVVQEMNHFALTGNMLNAIGRLPNVVDHTIVTSYPAKALPGDIAQAIPVDLLPLSPDQLKVFMQIEQPQFSPVEPHPLAEVAKAKPPATIGDFYDTITAGFTAVNAATPIHFNAAAHQVAVPEAGPITSVAEAINAVNAIKEEGEGTDKSPDQMVGNDAELAHFYVFQGILLGKSQFPTTSVPAGTPIRFPAILPFCKSTATPDPTLAFQQAFFALMTSLQQCWVAGVRPNVGAMRHLQAVGTGLIQQQIQPVFLLP